MSTRRATGNLRYNDRISARALGAFIFASRWLQAPIYVGLIIAQLVYVIVFVVDLWHLITDEVVAELLAHHSIDEANIMLAVLGLIDVAMIANLLIMVIVGGYETFVSKINLEDHPDEPEWLSHVNANVLKVKLAMAIIGISSIHLLRTFIEAGNIGTSVAANYTPTGVILQTSIHVVFILSAMGIAWVDRMTLTGGKGH